MKQKKNIFIIILVISLGVFAMSSCCISGYCVVDSSSQNTYKTENNNTER
ncbi:MAG: hypothetical protein ACK5M3_03035 [Dysgonomonas sp.]